MTALSRRNGPSCVGARATSSRVRWASRAVTSATPRRSGTRRSQARRRIISALEAKARRLAAVKLAAAEARAAHAEARAAQAEARAAQAEAARLSAANPALLDASSLVSMTEEGGVTSCSSAAAMAATTVTAAVAAAADQRKGQVSPEATALGNAVVAVNCVRTASEGGLPCTSDSDTPPGSARSTRPHHVAKTRRSESSLASEKSAEVISLSNLPPPSPPPHQSLALASPIPRPPPAPFKRRASKRIMLEVITPTDEDTYDENDSFTTSDSQSEPRECALHHVSLAESSPRLGDSFADALRPVAEKRVTFDVKACMSVSATEVRAEDDPEQRARAARTSSEEKTNPESTSEEDTECESAYSAPHSRPVPSSSSIGNLQTMTSRREEEEEVDLHTLEKDVLMSHSSNTLLANNADETKERKRVKLTLDILPRSKSAVDHTNFENPQNCEPKRKMSKRRSDRRSTPIKATCEDSAIALEQEQGVAKKMRRVSKVKKKTKKVEGRSSHALVDSEKSQIHDGRKDSNKGIVDNKLIALEDLASGSSRTKSKTGNSKQVSLKRKRTKQSTYLMPMKSEATFDKRTTRSESKGEVSTRKVRSDSSKFRVKKTSSPLRNPKEGLAKPKSAVPHSERQRPQIHLPATLIAASKSSPNLNVVVQRQSGRVNTKFSHIAQRVISVKKLLTRLKSKDDESQSDPVQANRSSRDVAEDRKGVQETLSVLSLLESESEDTQRGEARAKDERTGSYVSARVPETHSNTSSAIDSMAKKKILVETMPWPATPKKTLQAIVQAATGEGKGRTVSGDTPLQASAANRSRPVDTKTRLQRKGSVSGLVTAVRSSHSHFSIQAQSSAVKLVPSKHRLLPGKAPESVSPTSLRHGSARRGSARALGNKTPPRETTTKSVVVKKLPSDRLKAWERLLAERPVSNNSHTSGKSRGSHDGYPLRRARTVTNQLWFKQPPHMAMRAQNASCPEGSRSTARMLGLESSANYSEGE